MNKECLIKLKAVLDPEDYQKLEDAYNRGDGAAWGDVVETSHERLSARKNQKIQELKVKKNLVDYANKKLGEKMDPDQIARNLVSNTWKTGTSGTVSLERKIFGYAQLFRSRLADMFHASRPKLLGLARSRDSEYAHNLVKNIFGDADSTVGKGADKAADSWKSVKTEIDNTINKLAGRPKTPDFNGLPITHRPEALSRVGQDKWMEIVKENMVVDPAGVSSLPEEELLEKVYKHYATDGSHSLSVEDFHQQDLSGYTLSKLLMPKNGEAWLTYAKTFGKHSSPIDAIEEYIDNASTRIGLLSTLGTKPQETFSNFVDVLRRKTGQSHIGKGAKNTLDHIIASEKGADGAWAETFKALRNTQTIRKLVGAPLTALSDPMFTSLEAMYRGGNPFKFLYRYVHSMSPAGSADKLLASRLALIGDYSMNRVKVVNRFSEAGGFGAFARAADFSTRVSGLNHMTVSGKTAFSLEMSSLLAGWAGKELNPAAQRLFSQFGITEGVWREIQKGVTTIEGVDFIDASKIPDADIAARFIGMINDSCSVAIPEPNAQVRSIAAGGAPANTTQAELFKTLTQFHSFGISTALTHIGRALDSTVPRMVRFKYSVATILGTTAMGAGILQLKDLASGKTPRTIESGRFWLDAMLQGGALGALGDLAFSDPDLFGGAAFYVVGPTFGDLIRIHKAVYGDLTDFEQASTEFSDILKGYGGKVAEQAIQFPTKLWYFRLAFQRNLIDQMNRWSDPTWDRKREREANIMADQEQDYWWRPGERLPEIAQ